MGRINIGLTVIIITYNESKHIRRCLESVQDIANDVFVVDSFSTDDTEAICRDMGGQVLKNNFVNHATQFNWALQNCPIETKWVMRLDADEYLLPELVDELRNKLPILRPNISGLYMKRRVHFSGKWIRYGAYYPTWLLRVWRHGDAVCEQRWMDEHIKLLRGESLHLKNDFVDDNLHGLTNWVSKHNGYASREAIDLMNMTEQFLDQDEVPMRLFGSQEERKRWLKYRYVQFPLFLRPFIYFFYRYFIKLGFLDGKEGLVWHFLQGFWYRFLVDAKLMELRRDMQLNGSNPQSAIKNVLGIEV
ncbi:glycosyl transferase [Desulfoluna limicola]|uniref:Glycosyl transferase n=1 Tax=Desulfoluna limicola TaxID=2810562 RepID=A0ABM7PE81_9BACT|nr:glycosyltransferase family 2 protein [Desulfoluna limicola]BCS95594.1 glycosyl transferase [Desulfoluna limicola]